MLRRLLLSTAIAAVSFNFAIAADPVVADDPPELEISEEIVSNENLTIRFDAGWSQIKLPDVVFGTIINATPAGSPTVDRFAIGDTTLDGYRFGLGAYGSEMTLLGADVKLGIKGFYAFYDPASSTETCTPPPGQVCNIMPIFDPGPGFDFSTNTFDSTIVLQTEREAQNWGLALEAMSAKPVGSGGITLSAGLAFKRMSDNLDTQAVVNSPTNAIDTLVSYSQDFETDYWGVYLGAQGSVDLGNGLALNLNGEAGAYYADTSYRGIYTSDQGQFATPVPIAQDVSLSNNEIAYIVSGRAELAKDLGGIELIGFIQGDFYSYAPEILYNDFDSNPVGDYGDTQMGTAIGNGTIFSFTVGAALKKIF